MAISKPQSFPCNEIAAALGQLNATLTRNGLEPLYAITLGNTTQELKLRTLPDAHQMLEVMIGGNTKLFGTYVLPRPER